MRWLIPILILACALAGCASVPVSSSAPPAQSAEECRYLSPEQVERLFDDWNKALVSRNVERIVSRYAEDSVLLPTISYVIRYNRVLKEQYFAKFVMKEPSGKIDWRRIYVGCNTAIDTGDYTFTYGNGEPASKARYTFTYRREGENWLISSHHSSLRPTTP